MEEVNKNIKEEANTGIQDRTVVDFEDEAKIENKEKATTRTKELAPVDTKKPTEYETKDPDQATVDLTELMKDIIISKDDGSHKHFVADKRQTFDLDILEYESASYIASNIRRQLKPCTNPKCEHRRNFAGRPANAARNNSNNNGQHQPQNRNNATPPSAYSPSSLGPPNIPPGPTSPSLTASMAANDHAHQNNQVPRNKVPIFFREDYAGFIVKGNFNTLAAKPQNVDEGEWLAHQIVEQNRLMNGMIKTVQYEDRVRGTGICNETTCPTMSAGSTIYTWIDTSRNPINLPAPTYIRHIQTWVNGKIQDPSLFPTDTFTSAPPAPTASQQQSDPNNWLGKNSGFPVRFETEVKNMYKQMFRCYAHLYWSHWLAFWHLSMNRDLNTCFVHFVNVGRIFGLISEKDTEPMQPLIDLWIRQGVLAKVERVDGASAPTSAGGIGAGTTSA